jgi:tRNA-Thr(GGU) m(6)t(6)A37 methyltransferase TsaA
VKEEYVIRPIGVISKNDGRVSLEIFPEYRDALLGLSDFSHVHVLYWFDQNDSPGERATLRVHPRRDKRNPITGVFATRSPARPNLIGTSVCKIEAVEEERVVVSKLDAFANTPIVDIKPYIPEEDLITDSIEPGWVNYEFDS